MKYRKVEIFTGHTFRVPERIQRVDHRSTHGWQLRYGTWKMFSDFSSDGSGAKAALELATQELLRRIARLPAPSGLRREAAESKSNDLPVGVCGPVVRLRKGRRVPECSFSVTIPRFGAKPTNKNVYIATQTTYTPEKYEAALSKAIALRANAEKAFQGAATRAKRAAAGTREQPTRRGARS